MQLGHLDTVCQPGKQIHTENVHYEVDAETGCWNWLKGTQRGYPVGYAHRRAYEAYYGVKVPAGFDCHHRCENPGCVKPSHIQPIDHAEHLRRHKRALSPLTVEQVREIKGSNEPSRVLAERYGVTIFVIHDIVRGKNWRDVEAERPPVYCPNCGELVGGFKNRRYCDARCRSAFNKRKQRAA